MDVRFRDCTCPDTPHDGVDGADDGDIVVLRDALGWTPGAIALRQLQEAVRAAADHPDFVTDVSGKRDMEMTRYVAEYVGETYLTYGPLSWNVVDENGPVPITEVPHLTYADAYDIVQACDVLYTNVVLDPLLKAMNGPSGNGSNDKPTRQTRRSSRTRPSPRSSSSRTASAGLRSVTSQ